MREIASMMLKVVMENCTIRSGLVLCELLSLLKFGRVSGCGCGRRS